MSNTVNERIAKVEERIDNAYKLLDGHEQEVRSLRISRHKHSGILQNHTGVLSGINESLDKLSLAIHEQAKETGINTQTIRDFKIMGKTALCLISVFGGATFALLAYIGNKLLGLW